MILLLLAALLGSQGGRDPGATALTSPPSPALRSQIDLNRELARAAVAWDADLSKVQIRWGSLGGCKPTGFHASYEQAEQGVYDGHGTALEYTNQDIVFFDDFPPLLVGDEWTITLNSDCDWSHIPLWETMLHEAGHTLGLTHTHDKHDVMYVIPAKGQKITRRDREQLRRIIGK